MSRLTNCGRKPKNAHAVSVSIVLPRALVDQVEDFAVREIHVNRADAILDLLERGLATTKLGRAAARRMMDLAAADALAGRS